MPNRVHQVRIATKKLRYTLEAFEDALAPGPSLITTVTALQDAGGEMHDAIAARVLIAPTVFVNGRMIFGKRTAAEIQELINDELERNRKADAGS